jgi:hypothetical protein
VGLGAFDGYHSNVDIALYMNRFIVMSFGNVSSLSQGSASSEHISHTDFSVYFYGGDFISVKEMGRKCSMYSEGAGTYTNLLGTT